MHGRRQGERSGGGGGGGGVRREKWGGGGGELGEKWAGVRGEGKGNKEGKRGGEQSLAMCLKVNGSACTNMQPISIDQCILTCKLSVNPLLPP